MTGKKGLSQFAQQRKISPVRGMENKMVGATGFEPATASSQS